MGAGEASIPSAMGGFPLMTARFFLLRSRFKRFLLSSADSLAGSSAMVVGCIGAGSGTVEVGTIDIVY